MASHGGSRALCRCCSFFALLFNSTMTHWLPPTCDWRSRISCCSQVRSPDFKDSGHATMAGCRTSLLAGSPQWTGVVVLQVRTQGKAALSVRGSYCFRIVHHSSFVSHHSSVIIHHSSVIIHHSSIIIGQSSCIIHHSSFIIHQSSCVIH